jgi:integrase
LPKNLRRQISDIRFFEQDEINLICKESITCYKNGKQIYRLGYAIILLLSTGMRIAELLGLKWSDVDFKNKLIKITKTIVLAKNRDKEISKKYIKIKQSSTKTNSSDRVIDLNDTALSALQEIYKINGNQEYVMATESGEVIGARNIDRMLRNILIKCNIKPCGVHALRHSYASMMFRNGVDVKEVSELLGHSDVSFTYNVYIHLIKEQKQKAASMIDKVISINQMPVNIQ